MVDNEDAITVDGNGMTAAEERHEERRRAELLDKARKQLAAATEEFQRGLKSVKDPQRRQRLTMAYVSMMQKYLAKAQQSLDRYQNKRQATQVDHIEDTPPV
jgi:hypothetical protein